VHIVTGMMDLCLADIKEAKCGHLWGGDVWRWFVSIGGDTCQLHAGYIDLCIVDDIDDAKDIW